MGPVFKQRTGVFVQLPEMVVFISLVAGKQYLVVGALHRIEAVDLHKADLLDQIINTIRINTVPRGMVQPLKMQKKPTGVLIAN